MCTCGEFLNGNLRAIRCPNFGALYKTIFVNKYKEDGTDFYIDLETDLDADGKISATFWDTVINAAPQDRAYFSPEFFNSATTPNSAEYETFSNGVRRKRRDGTIMEEITFHDTAGVFAGQLKKHTCNQKSFYRIDSEGNLECRIKSEGDTKLYPIDIYEGSFNIQPIFANNSGPTGRHNLLSFDWHPSMKHENLRVVTSYLIAIDLTTQEGLLDVYVTYSNISTTGFDAKFYTLYGDYIDPIVVNNILSAEFKSSVTSTASRLRNETDAADVTISSVSYDAATKLHTITFAAQTSADVLIVKPVRSGYDFSAVEANKVKIP